MALFGQRKQVGGVAITVYRRTLVLPPAAELHAGFVKQHQLTPPVCARCDRTHDVAPDPLGAMVFCQQRYKI